MKKFLIAPLLLTASLAACSSIQANKEPSAGADFIVKNAKVYSVKHGWQSAVAVKDGKFIRVGNESEALALQGAGTKVVDAEGRTLIPGLIDTHAHPIRAGLNYNLELRWDGVKSLKEGLSMVREQAERTPEGQWVRVVGGWSPHQFVENRFPTIEELNQASPNRPVFVLYLYTKAFVNRAGIKALGYTKNTKFPEGEVELDRAGNPTGVLTAKPNAFILYKSLVSAPSLNQEEKKNSTVHYFRELSRFGLTSVIDAGGGGFLYPDDHMIVKEMQDRNELPIRLPFYLFAPTPGVELAQFEKWTKMVSPATRHEIEHALPYYLLGGGENLTWKAADFENFMEGRPNLSPDMEKELEPIFRHLFKHLWVFRIHATYDESITRILNVVEKIKGEGGPFPERFIIDHAETVSRKNLERIKKLGGGISIQNRMAFQGEEFVKRYGKKAAEHAPPIGDILELGIPLGSGTDATRVSSFNPWLSLHWKVSGRTEGGLRHLSAKHRLSREKALYAMTKGAAWFSKEENVKGDVAEGEFADFAVLSQDYFSVPEKEIPNTRSLLTVMGGKVTHGEGAYQSLAPVMPEVIPAWSPVKVFGGFQSVKK